MSHNIEVTVTRHDKAVVSVSKKQVLDLAKSEIADVLNSFAYAARQEYLRELAASKNPKYGDKPSAEFTTEVYGRTIILYEVDGSYDHHNDYFSNQRIGDLNPTEEENLLEFTLRLSEAVSLLGGNYEN